ncbi:MAG: bifunctional methylenetetrahydrofolate dehydrogenase/methenyltetrahydrofolate cyclohydrolase FolD [Parvularculaceae bacterium]
MTDAAIIDGKAIATALREGLGPRAAALAERTGAPPGLAVVLVGEDPASAVYVRMKGKAAKKLGYRSVQIDLPADAPEAEVVAAVVRLNDDPTIDGILVQLPLPPHIDADRILELIDPAKDVDGFHPVNAGRLAAGRPETALVPCTPAGAVTLAKRTLGDDLSGARAVVIGRSNIVGRPAAQLLLIENCTVTIAHSRTKDLPAIAREADVLVAAVGRPLMVGGDWIRPGACVVDIGITRVDAPEKGPGETKLVGDVDFDAAREVAGSITPVPGGVGPMTIAMLMANTLTAAAHRRGSPDLAFGA